MGNNNTNDFLINQREYFPFIESFYTYKNEVEFFIKSGSVI